MYESVQPDNDFWAKMYMVAFHNFTRKLQQQYTLPLNQTKQNRYILELTAIWIKIILKAYWSNSKFYKSVYKETLSYRREHLS